MSFVGIRLMYYIEHILFHVGSTFVDLLWKRKLWYYSKELLLGEG